MCDEDSPLPTGWGIYIIEGLNKALVSIIFWLIALVVFVPGAIWAVLRDRGLGASQLALTILALVGSFLTSKFYEQVDT